ncbi:MAG: pilus assembly protein Flp/PilA [Thermomicrobiales bacterium]|jgi:pilus assembly protein Flp/PilA|nr:pilus assembly protein Flp/PilA [Thermomicrobiales bacterium]
MVEFVKALFGTFGNDEETEGQGLVEYALILVLISVVAITIMTTVGGQVSAVFTTISGSL